MSKTEKDQQATQIDYQNVDITNDFMFAYVMQRPDLCVELLRYLFPGHKIQKIRYLAADEESASDTTIDLTDGSVKTYPTIQKTLAVAFGKKGIRMDVYLDDGKTVYNVEMQTTDTKHLPKRARYYGGEIDVNELQRGQDYDKLKPTYIIFICTFDPFGKGLYRYTFRNKCDEVTGLELGDESYKVFFNTAGTSSEGEEISDELKELLKYMNNTKAYPVGEASYDLIRKIDEAVVEAKQNDEWRRAYMTYQVMRRDMEMQGEEKKAKAAAKEMYDDHVSVEKIARYLNYSVKTIEKWLGLQPA